MASRLYLTQLQGDGSEDNPYRSVLADNGYRCRRVADLRQNRALQAGWALWMCRTDDTQHAAAIATPGVVYVPIEDTAGNVLLPTDTVADIDPVKRGQMVAFLEARGIPTAGITLAMTIREAMQRVVRRGQIAAWLGADDFAEALDTRMNQIPAARRNRIQARLEGLGFVVTASGNTTVSELLESLIDQNDGAFPVLLDKVLL